MEKVLANVRDIQDIRAKRQKASTTAGRLVCLNFKVPMQVRQQLKIHAARQDVTMTELLLQLVDKFMNASVGPPPEISTKEEIKEMMELSCRGSSDHSFLENGSDSG
jgi:hypothetical protein